MKKLNKFVASAVAVAMIGGTSVAAFAAEATGDELGTASGANLVKYLEMAEGVTTPEVTFNFSLTPYSDSAYSDTTHMPDAKTTTISTANMTATAADDGASLYGTQNIAALFAEDTFDHAGEYVYVVTETGSTFTEADGETLTLDGQSYLIHIYVTNGDDGLEISNITAETAEETTTTDDEGNEVTTYTGTGDKVAPDTDDPTVTDPSDEDEDEDDDTTDGEGTDEATNGTELVGVVFDNNYEKTVSDDVTPNPDDPTSGSYGALGVTKTVEGEYGDKTAKFPFSITVTAPENYTGDTTVVANIYTGTTKGDDLTITYGQAYEFTLTDGQALVFAELPAGATYTVTENLSELANNSDKYTPTYTWVDVSEDIAGSAAAGADLALSDTGLIADTDDKNAAYYTNTFDDASVTPTGILMNNLPYIVLALVAVGGLVAYVVIRRKANDEA